MIKKIHKTRRCLPHTSKLTVTNPPTQRFEHKTDLFRVQFSPPGSASRKRTSIQKTDKKDGKNDEITNFIRAI